MKIITIYKCEICGNQSGDDRQSGSKKEIQECEAQGKKPFKFRNGQRVLFMYRDGKGEWINAVISGRYPRIRTHDPVYTVVSPDNPKHVVGYEANEEELRTMSEGIPPKKPLQS